MNDIKDITNEQSNIVTDILMSKVKSIIDDEQFINDTMYEAFKTRFARETKEALLNQKEIWIGDIGYITSEIMRQGTKTGEVIKNVKFKFKPSKKFKKEMNQELLGK